jgi:hypothetical protein
MSERQQADYIKSYLRRKFSADIPGLKAYADEVFGSATDEITVTTTSFEGGSVGGIPTFNKMTLLGAIEEVIEELDPTFVVPWRSRVVLPDYRFSSPV